MSRMETLRAHPYPAALLGAFILVAFGTFIIYRQSATLPDTAPSAWGGSGTLFAPEITPVTAPGDTPLPGLGGRDVPLYQYKPSAPESETSDFDFDAFVAALSTPDDAEPVDEGGGEGTGPVYSFIPSGLISTTDTGPRRSPVQEAIYRYGNRVGEYIETYESGHRNNAVILKNQIEDRGSIEKAAAVRALGSDLRALGQSLKRVEDVPEVFTYAHGALADSYIEAGQKLSAVPDAEGDQAFIAAINAYNAAADSFITNYVAISTLFSVNGIRFGPSDAGRVFMFSGQ